MDLKLVKYVVFSTVFWMTFSLPAQAAGDVSGNNCDWQDAASTVWEATKGAVGSAGSWLKDKGMELYEAGKEKAPEVKENIQNGVQQAGDEFSEFRADQEDQFWDWFENQTNSEVTSELGEAPAPTPAEPEMTEEETPPEADTAEAAGPVEVEPPEPATPFEIIPEETEPEKPQPEEVDAGGEPDESTEKAEAETEAEPFKLEMWQGIMGLFALASVAAIIGDIVDKIHHH